MSATRLPCDTDLVRADLEIPGTGLQPADGVIDVDQSVGIAVGCVAEVQRRDHKPVLGQRLVETLGTGQIAAVPGSAVEVDHRRKWAVALRPVKSRDQRLVAMAQIFDILGREFIIRHVTPFPGCICTTNFGDRTPKSAEPRS